MSASRAARRAASKTSKKAFAKKANAKKAVSENKAIVKTAEKLEFETPRSILLAPYAIIPASLLMVLIDQLFLGGWMQKHFPTLPEDLLFFVIFFNLPHIAASTLTFFDAEYLKHYRLRIAVPAVIIAGMLLGFPHLIYADWFTAILYLWTVIHVVGQQFGLTRMLGAGFGKTYFFWKWTALTTGILIYFGIYASEQVAPGVLKSISAYANISPDVDVPHAIMVTIWLMLVPFLILSYYVYKPVKTLLARRYVLGNTVTIVCAAGLYAAHYPFFVILIPRILHDVSAFIFYISHDTNRNRNGGKNIVYRALNFSHIPIYILCPVIAIAFAFPISYFSYLTGHAWAYRVLLFITLLHYYTDGFVWKNGAMHRDYIRLR